MGVTVFHCQSLLYFSNFPSLSKTKLGRSYFPPKDGSLLFASREDLVHPLVLSTEAYGNNRGISSQRTSAVGRIPKDDGSKERQLSGAKSSENQEEIISLLKRIRSSITSESAIAKKSNSKSSDEKASVESVLEVLRQSGRRGKTAMKEGNKTLIPRRGSSRKELKAEFSSPLTRRRPPSNFIRRSPIPSLTEPEESVKLRSLSLPDENKIELGKPKEVALQEVEKMKLGELKELAKSKGIKGYSRLKKAELIELLCSSYNC